MSTETPHLNNQRSRYIRIPNAWYVGAMSKELGTAPFPRTILDMPVVLFRDDAGEVGALIDRCPHRNVPLSAGRLVDGTLECSYHGWRFRTSGDCARIPVRASDRMPRRCNATALPVRERDGLIWVWANPDTEPDEEPWALGALNEPGLWTTGYQTVVEANLYAMLENYTDPVHQAFLHSGLYRDHGGRAQDVRAVVTRDEREVHIQYHGQSSLGGFAARLMASGLKDVKLTHENRAIMPCISQAVFRLGDDAAFITTGLFTPEANNRTRAYLLGGYKGRIPAWLVQLVLYPMVRRILAQDSWILRLQTENLATFGEEAFAHTELDTTGNQIWRLLELWEAGRPRQAVTPFEREVHMRL